MNAGEAVLDITDHLSRAGIDTARLDARLLIAFAMGVDTAYVFGYPETELTSGQQKDLAEIVERRARREPLARIVGEKEFWSLSFKVSAETLIPRPETETVVECVLEQLPERDAPLRVLDLGTGSGCLLLSLLSEYPNAAGVGIDISDDALGTARQNAHRHHMDTRAQFQKGNWCRGLGHMFPMGFDVIVSNPPYIPERDIDGLEPEVANFEPRAALAGGTDGLSPYRVLALETPKLLSSDGVIAFEVGWNQASDVANLGRAAGLEVLEKREDLAGIPRCVAFVLPIVE